MYEWLLFLHVLGAVVWVGGGIVLQALGFRLASTDDAQAALRFAKDGEWLGTRLFMPASILVLFGGIALTLEGDWGFDQVFVLAGLVGVASSIVIGAALLGPAQKRLLSIIEARGMNDPEARGLQKKIATLSMVDVTVLVVVVFFMTVKPG
jgi:uncharacterized membrane protein